MLSIIIFLCFLVLALFGLPIAHSLIVASEIGLLPSDRLGADFIVQQTAAASAAPESTGEGIAPDVSGLPALQL